MLQLNSVSTSSSRKEEFLAERLGLLEATNDGLDVFAHFGSYFGCDGYPRLDYSYPSPFPLDKKYRKSFRLSLGESGQIKFNDFAAQRMGDCFTFVRDLCGYTFKETITYIKNTVLNGWSAPVNVGALVQRSGRPRLIEKPLLEITPWIRDASVVDAVAAERYDLVGIDEFTRERYHCYYLGGAHISNRFDDEGKPADDYAITHTVDNPLYGYWYPTTDKWKLNRPNHPNKDFKWGPNNVRGADQPMFGQHLLPDLKGGKERLGILAPGQRDTMAAAAMLGCWVGCLSSESAHLHADQFGLLSAHFDQVAFFSDNDEAGWRAESQLQNEWGLLNLNPIFHYLGENDLCAWLKTPQGQGENRQRVAHDVLTYARSF